MLPDWIKQQLSGFLEEPVDPQIKEKYDEAVEQLAYATTQLVSNPEQADRWQNDINFVWSTLSSLALWAEADGASRARATLASILSQIVQQTLTGALL